MHNKTWGNCSGVFMVSGARGRSNEVHTVTPLPPNLFSGGDARLESKLQRSGLPNAQTSRQPK